MFPHDCCGRAGSELAGAAGVALQQPDDGRVALGTFDEFFQRQFACGTGYKEEQGLVILLS